MLNPRDNIGPDSAALPRRNIFAPPQETRGRDGRQAGGVFDPSAVCRESGWPVGDVRRGERGVTAANTGASAWVGRLGLVVIALAVAVIGALLVTRGADPVRSVPPPQVDRVPDPQTGKHPPVERRPRAREPRTRRTRDRGARRRPRPSPARARRVVPSPRVVPPAPAPAPLRLSAPPRVPGVPARVPASSPPEFM